MTRSTRSATMRAHWFASATGPNRATTPNTRGATAVEVALLVPVLVLVAAMACALWRLSWAQSQLNAAAAAGARYISLHPYSGNTDALAADLVAADMATAGLYCTSLAVNVSHEVPYVSASASCTVQLRDLLVPGLPASITLRATATELLDTFREQP
ncbi:MAG: pilus assembly protein [Propionibacteriaceae bacterium]|nr:pilus assembly protein [Propionibacteriaceae bacterium]